MTRRAPNQSEPGRRAGARAAAELPGENAGQDDLRRTRVSRWLRAGLVGRPHGLDGSFYVGAPAAALLLVGSRVVVDGREAQIVRRSGQDSRPIVRLEGFGDRSAAESLRGREMLVRRGDAPELEADEWWSDDLEGCEVRHAQVLVGTVARVIALPTCEALEVRRPDGGDLLVPLIADAVSDVDPERGVIEVDLEFLRSE